MLGLLKRLFSSKPKPPPEPIPVPEKMPSNVSVIRGEDQATVIWWDDKITAKMPVGELTGRLYVLRNEVRIIDHMIRATVVLLRSCSAMETTYLLADVGPNSSGEAPWYAKARLLVDEWWEQARPHVHSVKINVSEDDM